jgi:hypothetical protein
MSTVNTHDGAQECGINTHAHFKVELESESSAFLAILTHPRKFLRQILHGLTN